VHGFCLSGGGEMASMCDLTICSDDAVFGHPAARANGIPPTLALWPLKIGLQRTKELLFTGDTISGQQAAEWGIANRCVPRAELSDHVLAYAQRIAMIPVDALTVHKHVTNRWYEIMGVRTMVDEGAEFDAIYHQLSVVKEFSKTAREKGVKAALEARDAPFRTGR
jgi:enoyl-CoA hydratase